MLQLTQSNQLNQLSITYCDLSVPGARRSLTHVAHVLTEVNHFAGLDRRQLIHT